MPVNYFNVAQAQNVQVNPAGNITATDVQSALAGLDANRQIDNLLVNSSFEVAQDGTNASVDATYIADQWAIERAGTTLSASRQDFAIGQTDVPNNPKHFIRGIVSSVAGAGNYAIIEQPIEDVTTLSGQTATLSFWAKADSARNMAVEFMQSFGSGGSPSTPIVAVFASKVALTTVWKKFTFSFLLPSIFGKTLGTNGNDYLKLFFWLDAGSNFNARTNSLGQQSGTFDIACPKLEAGNVATPWVREDPSINWARCLRYYNRETATALYGMCINPADSNRCYNISFPVAMRINPSYAFTISPIATISLASLTNKSISFYVGSGTGMSVLSAYIFNARL